MPLDQAVDGSFEQFWVGVGMSIPLLVLRGVLDAVIGTKVDDNSTLLEKARNQSLAGPVREG
jgi:hypothetical protein